MESESRAQSQSSAEPRSEAKIWIGQKRDIMGTEETSKSSYKRVKLSDLESVWPSKDVKSDCTTLDLNVKLGPVSAMFGEPNKLLTSAKNEKNEPLDLDLNTKDISSSINNDPLYPLKNYKHLKKSRNDSECESSVGPPDEKDPMGVWKGLKQNNYMSTQYGVVPTPPIQKTQGRKRNTNDVMKKKMELAKKEQIDRFAKVAAPSGLLNGLNPGIINHVRNRKQVHSIIEALVRSERTENLRFGSKKGDEIKNSVGESMENDGRVDCGSLAKSTCLGSEITRGDGDSYMGQTRSFENLPLERNVENKDDGLVPKLSSSGTVASENTSCLSVEESGNFKSVTSLSFKGPANVASQWLDLLNQDIKGRLAALRRSKKRVQAVISTELPDLMSREFSSNTGKDSYVTKGSTPCGFDKASGDAHAARWSTLFGQMDKSLSEEESHLEIWLNQVKEMQLHCENGLRNSLYNASQETGPTGNYDRLEDHNSEKDLDVSAAAASIYSTCNFLLTMENLPCC